MKNTINQLITFILSILMIIGCTFSSQGQDQDPSIDFDNVRLSFGSIFSNIDGNPGGMAIGLSTEYTAEMYLFGGSADFNFATKKLASLTFDLGGGLPAYITDDADLFLGISSLSLNLNTYGGGVANSAFLLKVRYKEFIYEGKTTFWNWQKGRDPVLKENGYYGVSYRFPGGLITGVNYRLYAEGASFLNFNIGMMW
jgi:hypothetical protein